MDAFIAVMLLGSNVEDEEGVGWVSSWVWLSCDKKFGNYEGLAFGSLFEKEYYFITFHHSFQFQINVNFSSINNLIFVSKYIDFKV